MFQKDRDETGLSGCDPTLGFRGHVLGSQKELRAGGRGNTNRASVVAPHGEGTGPVPKVNLSFVTKSFPTKRPPVEWLRSSDNPKDKMFS